MIYIDAQTVAAESEADLRSAVSNNNGYNYVYLATNITLTSGITVYAGKTSLVIDGRYPIGGSTIHEFTDIDSIFADATLGVRSASNIALTLRNMVIHGYNYYGVPYIAGGLINTSGVSVIYENVTYTGPQITYNHYGLTRYTDCNITITQTGSLAAEEVGEVNRVEIGGVTRITHRSTTDAVFWFRDSNTTSSFTILEGADVEISSDNYYMYNLDGTFGTTLVPTNYTIEPNASLSLTVNKGISYNASHQLNSFTVGDGASFHYIQTANNGTAAALYMNSALTVNPGANFYMQAANGTQPLLFFTSGTPQRSLTVNNPLSFVLYSPNAAALHSEGNALFTFHGGQLNTWNPATVPVGSAGGFEDTPAFKWFKNNYATVLDVNGTFAQTTTTATSNLVSPDDNPYPALTNLHLHEARVVSIGDWPVTINPVLDDGSPITGQMVPGANIRIRYTLDGTTHTLTGTAGPDGNFSIVTTGETPPSIPAGTVLTVESNIPFLIKSNTATAIEAGELTLVSAPVRIVFNTPAIIAAPDVFLRRYYPQNDERVIVLDARAISSYWQIFASITGDLETPGGDTLPNALVFRRDDNTLLTLSDQPQLVYTGEPNGGVEKTTEITWAPERGVLVHVTGPIRRGVEYTSNVIWHLDAVDEP